MTSSKFENVRAPIDSWDADQGFLANDFGVRKFDVTTSSQAHALPQKWFGRSPQWVDVWSTVDDAEVAFSTSASAEVDRTVAATAAGASAKVGMPIPQKQWTPMLLPTPPAGGNIYFVRQSATAGIIRVRLSSSP